MGDSHWGLFAGLLRPHRRALALYGVTLSVATSLPLVGPLLLGRFVDASQRRAPYGELLALAGGYISVGIVASIVSAIMTWRSTVLAWRVTDGLRHELVENALHADLAFHRDHPTGELVSRIDADVTAMTNFLGQFVARVLGIGCIAVFAVVILAFVEPLLAVPLSLVLGLALHTAWRHRNDALAEATEERTAESNVMAFVEERLAATGEISALGGGHDSLRAMVRLSERLVRAVRARADSQMRAQTAIKLSVVGGELAMIATGAAAFASGRIGIGAVFVGYRFASAVRDPVDTLSWRLQDLQGASGSARRVLDLLVEQRRNRRPGQHHLPTGPLEIELVDVTLRYDDAAPVAGPASSTGADDRDDAALRDVSLRIPARRCLGVVGRTGSGKTSLARLILALITPTEGKVAVGGISLADVEEADLRRRIAAIPQDVQVFPGTIRDNATLFASASDALDDTAVRTALTQVGLWPWLDGQRLGLDQPLNATGDRAHPEGAGLSAGEAQLLALARCLLRAPDVVVLDEATSRIDPMTQERIAAATAALVRDRTAVIIAHRLETLAICDDIAVFEAGRLVEFGPRQQLEADPTSRYAALRRGPAHAEELS